MVLVAVQLVRVCVSVFAIQYVLGMERRRHTGPIRLDNSNVEFGRDTMKGLVGDADLDGIYEFGRNAARHLEEIINIEKINREILEVEIMDFSMSLSLSMSMDYNAPSLPTIPNISQGSDTPSSSDPSPAPFAVVSGKAVSLDACIGQSSTNMTVFFEVDLAIGKEEFTADLTKILVNTLSNEYQQCTESRRHLDVRESDYSARLLQQDGGITDTRLGAITIEETDRGCVPTSVLARSCRTAKANFEVFGDRGDAIKSIGTSLESIMTNNSEFENELMMNGIVGVRVANSTSVGPDESKSSSNSSQTDPSKSNSSQADSSQADSSQVSSSQASSSPASSSQENSSATSSSGSLDSGRATIAIVLSVAAVSLVVLVILRRGRRRREEKLMYAAAFDEEGYVARVDDNVYGRSIMNEAPYGFADPTPINVSSTASC